MSFVVVLFFQHAIAFEKNTLVFETGKKISIEVAITAQDKAQGLMNRKSLDIDSGMLFIFPHEQKLSFWMKNTYVPLTIGFFNSKRILLETLDMKPSLGPVSDEKLPQYASSQEAQYALEMTLGWFQKNKIKPGMSFKILNKVQ